jgi:hypothetical protein
MEGIELIYGNYLGASFYLKQCTIKEFNKIQIVFQKTVFHLKKEGLEDLHSQVEALLIILSLMDDSEVDICSATVDIKENEVNYFSLFELKALKNLISGTLFILNFNLTVK